MGIAAKLLLLFLFASCQLPPGEWLRREADKELQQLNAQRVERGMLPLTMKEWFGPPTNDDCQQPRRLNNCQRRLLRYR